MIKTQWINLEVEDKKGHLRVLCADCMVRTVIEWFDPTWSTPNTISRRAIVMCHGERRLATIQRDIVISGERAQAKYIDLLWSELNMFSHEAVQEMYEDAERQMVYYSDLALRFSGLARGSSSSS